MDNEVKEFLAALQKKLVSIDYIKTEDIPNIGLYMDPVSYTHLTLPTNSRV